MLPDRVSNPGPLTYESGALPIALRGPAPYSMRIHFPFFIFFSVIITKGDKFCDFLSASLDEVALSK